MRKLIFVLALLLGSAMVQAQSVPDGLQQFGEIEGSNSIQRTINFNGDVYRVAGNARVTAAEGRILDVFLLPPGQPIGITWRQTGSTKTITHIHIFDQLPQ